MIYLDNAATTPLNVDLHKTLLEYSACYNPSSLHKVGMHAKNAIKSARAELAATLGCNSNELYFTSSGSESNNTVLFGAHYRKGSNIIMSSTEHSSIYYAAKELQNRGVEVQFAKCNAHGQVDKSHLISLINDNTMLVSIMHVNNETGALNDIADLVKIVKLINANIIFHSDGVQAVGKINLHLHNFNVDAYSFSGHKFGAPKGVGGMFIKRGVNIAPLIYGGGQESGMRSSTENVAGIAAMAEGLMRYRQSYNPKHIYALNDKLENGILKLLPTAIINSNLESNPNILSVALPDLRGEIILNMLSDKGIMIATGSACASNKSNNRIAAALGLGKVYDKGMLRFSPSSDNTTEDIDTVLDEMAQSIKFLT